MLQKVQRYNVKSVLWSHSGNVQLFTIRLYNIIENNKMSYETRQSTLIMVAQTTNNKACK